MGSTRGFKGNKVSDFSKLFMKWILEPPNTGKDALEESAGILFARWWKCIWITSTNTVGQSQAPLIQSSVILLYGTQLDLQCSPCTKDLRQPWRGVQGEPPWAQSDIYHSHGCRGKFVKLSRRTAGTCRHCFLGFLLPYCLPGNRLRWHNPFLSYF